MADSDFRCLPPDRRPAVYGRLQFRPTGAIAGIGRAISLDEQQRQALLAEVYQFWAQPNRDPATPPPHSTGGAVDVTLLDPIGDPADMGSPIDEISPRSYPNHFADSDDPLERDYHANREHLHAILHGVGFCRHPNEWWHFCLGDQMWAWLRNVSVARYGGVE